MSSLEPTLLQPMLGVSLFESIERQQPKFPTLSDWSESALLEASHGRRFPVLLKGCGQGWRSHKRWELAFFRNALGHIPVLANLYSGRPHAQTSLGHLVEQVLKPQGESIYLQEWWYELDAPHLIDDFEIPECFARDFSLQSLGYRNSHLWIGSAGATTPIHQDEAHSDFWSYQANGTKRWLLMHPDTRVSLKPDGTVDLAGWQEEWRHMTWTVCMNAGDVLYVPDRWWHAVQALSPNVTLRNVHVWPDQSRQYFRDILSLPTKLALRGESLRTESPMQFHQLQVLCTRLQSLLARPFN
jgi:hypothetical protein